MLRAKYLDIAYQIEGKNFTERFDVDLKFKCFVNIVEVSHAIRLEDFEIFYMGSKLGTKFYNYPMRDIVRIDTNPLFVINPINFEKQRVKSPRKYRKEDKSISINFDNVSSPSGIIEILDSKLKDQYKVESEFERKVFSKPKILNENSIDSCNKSLTVSISNISKAYELFNQIKSTKSHQKELRNVAMSIKLVSSKKPPTWEETNFFSSLTSRNLEYTMRRQSLNRLPSAKEGQLLSKRLSTEENTILSINKKIKNNMDYEERLLFLKQIEPEFVNISDPYVEVNRLKRAEEVGSRLKWIGKNFDSVPERALDKRSGLNIKLPVPISSQVRIKFKDLMNSRSFSRKLQKK